MAYVKTTWVDEVTALSAANFNKIEQGIADAHSAIFEVADIKWTARKYTADPTGWAIGDGRAVTAAMTALAALRAALIADGNPYGVSGADPLLPDARDRTLIGVNPGALTGRSIRALGATGGAENVALTVAQLPKHAHPFLYRDTITGSAGGSNTPQVRLDAPNNATLPAGHGQNPIGDAINGGNEGNVHENMPPFLALTLLIKT